MQRVTQQKAPSTVPAGEGACLAPESRTLSGSPALWPLQNWPERALSGFMRLEDRGQGGDARLVQSLQGTARLPPLLGPVSASLPPTNRHVLGQTVVIRRGSIMIVKLPFSIHSTGIFLGVYFWRRAILGAGRARGEGEEESVQCGSLGASDGWRGMGCISVWSLEDETARPSSVGGSLIIQ